MNADNPDRDEARFDDFAGAAGQALRRPAPDGGLAGIRSARHRQRVTRAVAASGAAAIVFIAGALLLTTNQNDSERLLPSNSTISTTPDSSTSTSTPTTSTTPTSVEPSVGPLVLRADTPVLWADGVLVAAWADDRFVPVSETTGLPPQLLGAQVELMDRTGDSSVWTSETDECGITRLRSVDGNQRFAQGYLWSSDYPMSSTLDGASQSDSAELDTALSDLGLDPATLDRIVPTVDLDGDPGTEVVIVRYDPTTPSTDPRNVVWLAIWDPADTSITTLAGDPISDDTHFTAFGDGFADLDANGLYDTSIDTGETVTLIELSTARVLSTVDTACSTPAGAEIVLRPDGIGSHTFGASQSVVEATLTEAFGQPEVVDRFQSAPVFTCRRWGCTNSTVLRWPDTGLLVAFSDRSSDGETLPKPVLAAWTLTSIASWSPGDVYVPNPNSTNAPLPEVRLVLDNGIGLGSTVAELRSAFPSTAESWWNDSTFVPTGLSVSDPGGLAILDGDLDWDIVTELQAALIADGASLNVDGIAGPATTAAFTAYRERTGLDDPAAALAALGITGPAADVRVVRLSAGDWFWELSCGDLEAFGIPSNC